MCVLVFREEQAPPLRSGAGRGYLRAPHEYPSSAAKKILGLVPRIFLSNPKDWHGINALARCMELRRSRAWHRAKRASNFVLLRIDAIHHFVMIPYDCFAINSIPQHVADFIHAFGVIWSESPPHFFPKALQSPRFYAILIAERRWYCEESFEVFEKEYSTIYDFIRNDRCLRRNE